jgi:hypothetical protein
MSFLKKGPEVKLSEIKVPGIVEDVYYDLKDRHLLPVAVILLIAIVAIPIAISGNSSSEVDPPPGAAEAGASQLGGAVPTGAMVAQAAPGLREYKRRLEHEQPRDPFYNEDDAASAEASGGGGEVEITESSSGSSTPSESFTPPETPPSVPGPGETGTPGKMTYFSTAIDVRITGGSGEKKETTVRKNLPELTMLPSRETPAIIFIGATKDEKKAVMTVSSDVQSIFGDAKCILGSETCQMLMMEVGMPVTFVYGGAEKTYTMELLKVHMVESDKVNKAPLGEGENKKGKGKEGLSTMPDGVSDGD